MAKRYSRGGYEAMEVEEVMDPRMAARFRAVAADLQEHSEPPPRKKKRTSTGVRPTTPQRSPSTSPLRRSRSQTEWGRGDGGSPQHHAVPKSPAGRAPVPGAGASPPRPPAPARAPSPEPMDAGAVKVARDLADAAALAKIAAAQAAKAAAEAAAQPKPKPQRGAPKPVARHAHLPEHAFPEPPYPTRRVAQKDFTDFPGSETEWVDQQRVLDEDELDIINTLRNDTNPSADGVLKLIGRVLERNKLEKPKGVFGSVSSMRRAERVFTKDSPYLVDATLKVPRADEAGFLELPFPHQHLLSIVQDLAKQFPVEYFIKNFRLSRHPTTGERVRTDFFDSSFWESLQRRDGPLAMHILLLLYGDETSRKFESMHGMYITLANFLAEVRRRKEAWRCIAQLPELPEHVAKSLGKELSTMQRTLIHVYAWGHILTEAVEAAKGVRIYFQDNSYIDALLVLALMVGDLPENRSLMGQYICFSADQEMPCCVCEMPGTDFRIPKGVATSIRDIEFGSLYKIRKPLSVQMLAYEMKEVLGRTVAKEFVESHSSRFLPNDDPMLDKGVLDCSLPLALNGVDPTHVLQAHGFPTLMLEGTLGYINVTLTQAKTHGMRQSAWAEDICMNALDETARAAYPNPAVKFKEFACDITSLPSFGRNTNNWIFLMLLLVFFLDGIIPTRDRMKKHKAPSSRAKGGGCFEELAEVLLLFRRWYRALNRKSFTDAQLVELENLTILLKAELAKVFPDVNWSTPKMHVLDHLTQYVRMFGPIANLDTAWGESFHKFLKDAMAHSNHHDNAAKSVMAQMIKRHGALNLPNGAQSNVAPSVPYELRAVKRQRKLEEIRRREANSGSFPAEEHNWRALFALDAPQRDDFLPDDVTLDVIKEAVGQYMETQGHRDWRKWTSTIKAQFHKSYTGERPHERVVRLVASQTWQGMDAGRFDNVKMAVRDQNDNAVVSYGEARALLALKYGASKSAPARQKPEGLVLVKWYSKPIDQSKLPGARLLGCDIIAPVTAQSFNKRWDLMPLSAWVATVHLLPRRTWLEQKTWFVCNAWEEDDEDEDFD